jgi:hypothetical protein
MRTSPNVPPVQRRRRARDLARAESLRPRDVFELHGIPASTLRDMCTHPDPAVRLPSLLIPGRQGRRGVRLIKRTDLNAWLEKFSTAQKNAA